MASGAFDIAALYSLTIFISRSARPENKGSLAGLERPLLLSMKLLQLVTDRDERLPSIVVFSLVGGFGFTVEGSLLTYLSVYEQWDIYLSRLLAFSVAILVTWLLNRNITFAARKYDSPLHKEGMRYFLVQSVAAATNILVFAALVYSVQLFLQYPVLPLIVGGLCGWAINYTAASRWVYKQRNTA